MAQPTPYVPQTDFSDYQASTGEPCTGTQLDTEFADLQTTLDETLANLAVIQRDDTHLANSTVSLDTLDNDLKIIVLREYMNYRGAWVAFSDYAANDVIKIVLSGIPGDPGYYFVAVDSHQATGTFATDVVAGHWDALSGIQDDQIALDILQLQTDVAALDVRLDAIETALNNFIDGMNIEIAEVEDRTYTFYQKAPFAGTINETVSESDSGTCTATFKINGTPLGGTANSVSSTEETQAHASANAFVAGDDIAVTISANAACEWARLSVKYTRDLLP